MISATVVISSRGGAVQHLGGMLGQYEYLEDKEYYVQTSTERCEEWFRARYLFRDEDDKWWVSDIPGEKIGWLYNPRSSQTLPSSGWRYADNGSWHDDLTMTVTPGPLTLPRQFTVTIMGAAAERHPTYQGVFTKRERWLYGRPVYVNKHGRTLHHGGTWEIGYNLGQHSPVRGSRARDSPVNEKSWTYWTGSERKPALVTVTGSN